MNLTLTDCLECKVRMYENEERDALWCPRCSWWWDPDTGEKVLYDPKPDFLSGGENDK